VSPTAITEISRTNNPLVIDGLGLSDVAAFFYTSGTTGNSKGVPTTHEAFLASTENMLTCLGLRTLISVPLFHVTGCNSQRARPRQKVLAWAIRPHPGPRDRGDHQ